MSDNKMENLPLEWIRVFEAAGRTGSFTAAAHEIGLTQAAVSQRIRNLEHRIGAQLFLRQARGVVLTIDGEAWLPYVTNALQSLDRSAEDLFGKPIKKVTLSASASVTQLWIARRLARMVDKPSYQISITTMNIEPDFAKANAMVEIRHGTGVWPNMLTARLFDEKLKPLASPKLLESGVPWHTLPRIAVSGPRLGWQDWALKTEDTPPPIPKYRFDSFVAAHSAAVAGLGVILGSLPLCAKELADKSLVSLSDKYITQETGYWLASKVGALPRRQWDELVACLCEV